MSDHLLAVDKSVDRHGWVRYRGRCSCTWAGPWQSSKGHAVRQHERHVQDHERRVQPEESQPSADPGSSGDEIRAEYRRRIKEVHPDHGGNLEDALRVIAEYEAFRDDDS